MTNGEAQHHRPGYLLTGFVLGMVVVGFICMVWALLANQASMLRAQEATIRSFREAYERTVLDFTREGQAMKAQHKHNERLLRLIAVKSGATPAEIRAATHPDEPAREGEP